MATTKKNYQREIEFSKEIGGNRWFVFWGCNITTHCMIVLIEILRSLADGYDKYNSPFMLFRNTLLKSRLEKWQCTDPLCLFYNIKRMAEFSVTAYCIWHAMPEELQSIFKKEARNLKLRLKPTEITSSKALIPGITFLASTCPTLI